MTVKDFAKAACKPKKFKVYVCGAEYSLINTYDGGVDEMMLSILGDYIVETFKANEPDDYCVWVLEVPVKKEAST